MFSVVSVPFLLDLSYLLFLCVEWCSFIALVSGCVDVRHDRMSVVMVISSHHIISHEMFTDFHI